MLYSGHLVMVDTSSWNWLNHGQTLIDNRYLADTFIATNCYSERNFLAPREMFQPNLSLYSGYPICYVGK